MKNMPESNLFLKPNPTLRDFQDYIAAMVVERGFDKETVSEVFMMFLEECGEMAKAARKGQKLNLENEVADVFIYLLDLCNILDVDLEKAFRDKEEINKQRTWK